MAERPTGTVTLLFTDIAGSTRLLQRLGPRYPAVLAQYRTLLRASFQANAGQEIDLQGDGFFVAFPRARDAVAAAVAIQRTLAAYPWPEGVSLDTRMGLHTGEPHWTGEGYVGLDVHRAARIADVGHGGQVLLSDVTRALVEQHLPQGVRLLDLGAHRLKDLPHPEHLFQVSIDGLAATFPPLRTLDARRTNVPAPSTALIGREREVTAVADLLRRDDVRLVTLTGPGGTGKTRLSLQVAATLVDDFPDGVWLVDLANISDSSLVASTIATTLDVPEPGGQPLVTTLQANFRDKHLLLLLDNFEQVLAAAPLIGDLLTAAPHLTVLATSRARLQLYGEHEFPVPPLAVPDAQRGASDRPDLGSIVSQYAAVALFIERARAVQPDFQVTNANAPAVAEICARLDGLPLAIELAAARSKLFAPQAMLARLDKPLKLLVGGPHDRAARQQTLRGAITWSYDLLEPAEQRLFARLAVFAGGCTVEAVEAVCSRLEPAPAPGPAIQDPATQIANSLDVLQSLLDKSLLRMEAGPDEEPRFRMLDTIRDYATERLVESGELAMLQAQHAQFFVALAEAAEPQLQRREQGAWLQRLEADHGNFRAALQWSQAVAPGNPAGVETGWRLAAALWRFWNARGHSSEGRGWLDAVLSHRGGPELAASGYLAKALRCAGEVAADQGEFARANALFEESLSIYRQRDDPVGIAFVLVHQGRTLRWQGDYARVEALEEEALRLFREHGRAWDVGFALLSLGDVALDQGQAERATARFREALRIYQELGDTVGAAWALINLGRAAYVGGNAMEATGLYTQSLKMFQGLEYGGGVVEALLELARTAHAQREDRRAMRLYQESIALCRERGWMVGLADCLAGMAAVSAAAAQPAAAARLFGAAAAIRRSVNAPLPPVAQAAYERDVAVARSQLDPATWEAAWAEGMGLPLEQVLDDAREAADELQ